MQWVRAEDEFPKREDWYLVYVPESMGHYDDTVFMCRFDGTKWRLPYEGLTVFKWLEVPDPFDLD
jgi:hypothetical protein